MNLDTTVVKPKRTRKAIEGHRIAFVIDDAHYAKLEAAAKSDMRTVDNFAMLLTVKGVDNLANKAETPKEAHRESQVASVGGRHA